MYQNSWFFMECKTCDKPCQKWGRQKNGCQRWYCKNCKKAQQAVYKNNGCLKSIGRPIGMLVCESAGIRGIGRVLGISTTTVLRKIKFIAAAIDKPPVPKNRAAFELDEVRTYVKYKGNEYWIAYAICPHTKAVIDFAVGKRNKRVLRQVVNTLLLSGVQCIKTDKLNIYQSLIPPAVHISAAYNTNHIERNNLNLRTHLKRLSRRTICISKTVVMLEACMRIYFWGGYSYKHQRQPLACAAA
jgi:insertion element IS1 protein InsB